MEPPRRTPPGSKTTGIGAGVSTSGSQSPGRIRGSYTTLNPGPLDSMRSCTVSSSSTLPSGDNAREPESPWTPRASGSKAVSSPMGVGTRVGRAGSSRRTAPCS